MASKIVADAWNIHQTLWNLTTIATNDTVNIYLVVNIN